MCIGSHWDTLCQYDFSRFAPVLLGEMKVIVQTWEFQMIRELELSIFLKIPNMTDKLDIKLQ